MTKKALISVAILINLLFGAVVVLNSQGQALLKEQKIPFAQPFWQSETSQRQLPKLLQHSWSFYKQRFLKDGTHVLSNNYGGTITEGQSYALLKAVWMDDPETFRNVWHWTRLNMKRPQDHLLGWRWGQKADGTNGLMETENATDADQDIAYALLLAGEKWHDPVYTRDGLNIVSDLWRLNVRIVNGRYYLLPGTWEGFQWEYLTLDPSYFAPYVYRKFAQYDKANAFGWNRLADDMYDTLEACSNLTQPKLPPNWCAVKWQDNGQGSPIIFSDRQGEGSRDFSYDAFRVYWRMAMDARLSPPSGAARAQRYLKEHAFLLSYWETRHVMPEGFTSNGLPRTMENSGFGMGPLLITNHFAHSQTDAALYQQTLAKSYNPAGYWSNDYNDYLHSVIWLHLYALELNGGF